MHFLVDAQLPPALARWLSDHGHEADHVMDHDLHAASDEKIWAFAIQSNAIIVTKEEDFARRRAMVETGPYVVWLRLPNSRRSDLLDWFRKALPGIVGALDRGETLVEVR